MDKTNLEILNDNISKLNDSLKTFKHSYDLCSNLKDKENFSLEELDKLEALTSRFARISDLIVQKVFRAIDILDLDDSGTIRDRINRAHKKGIIDDAQVFIEIREIRNLISHEYEDERLNYIFKKVIAFAPVLIKSIEKVQAYCKKNYETK